MDFEKEAELTRVKDLFTSIEEQYEYLKTDNARLLALNEKMRKALEGFASFPHVERDADHPMWGNFDDSYSHGASVAESQVADIAREALQTEKEEKPR